MAERQSGWRRYQRIIPPPDAPVQVKPDSFPEASLVVSDLSEDGMELQFSGLESVQVDDVLSLTIQLPLEAPVHTKVRVRHINRAHIGVTFASLEPRQQQAVRRYIQRFAVRPPLWQRLRQLWLA